MITSPSADFTIQEALNLGARPWARFIISPFYHPNGVDGEGNFSHTAFVSPDRIQADYEGFASGYWQSEAIHSKCGLFPTAAVITWDYNSPAFTMIFAWRTAATLSALNAASWTTLTNGITIQIQQFYQFKLTLAGKRCWARYGSNPITDFTAYAMAGEPDELVSYATFAHVPGEVQTYIENLQLLGEFPVADEDVEKAGTITVEAPKDFSDLVAGSHDGLSLNNRHLDDEGNYAPLFTPGKSSFVFGNELDSLGRPAWFSKELEIQFGYILPDETFTGFTAWRGKIIKWGPPRHAADASGRLQAHTCDIYARDWISDLFKTKLALAAADGSPQPLTAGEFLCKAETVSGWSPASILRSAYFESNNYNEFDHLVTAGGGAVSLITPGLTGSYAFRAQSSGANQSAYGKISLASAGEVHIKGNLRFYAVPETFAAGNLTFLQLQNAAGTPYVSMTIDAEGMIYESHAGQGRFNISAYTGVVLPFILWTDGSNLKFWLNGDEVLTWRGTLTTIQHILFGILTGATAENWSIDFDDLEIRPKYYDGALRVTGAPFAGIGPVYIDNIAQPDSKTAGGFTQTLTRYPTWGMVQFESTDPNFKPGDVLMRVIQDAGGIHAVDYLQTLLGLAGVTDLINTASFTAVKTAKPLDIIHFRKGDKDPFPVSDAIKEICSRCLYWLVVDHGEIKLFAYDGDPPSGPVLTLTESHISGLEAITDMDAIMAYVSAKYGWYDRDSGLSYTAGDINAGDGQDLDYTWFNSPVVSENYEMVKLNADLLLKFLGAQERWDPVSISLKGARLELFDVVAINNPAVKDAVTNTRLIRKEIILEAGNSPLERVSLQLYRFLGES